MRQMLITLAVGLAALSAMSDRVMKVGAAEESGDVTALKQQQKTPVTADAGDFKIFLSLLEAAYSKLHPNPGNRDNDWVAYIISDLAALRPGNDPREAEKRGAATPFNTAGTLGVYTVFAPNDAAFGRLPKGAVEALRKDPERLKKFLRAHIVPSKIMLVDMLASPGGDIGVKILPNSSRSLRALDGSAISICPDDPNHVAVGSPCGSRKGAGKIIRADIPAGGGASGKVAAKVVGEVSAGRGVIHVIDAVLVPDGPPLGKRHHAGRRAHTGQRQTGSLYDLVSAGAGRLTRKPPPL